MDFCRGRESHILPQMDQFGQTYSYFFLRLETPSGLHPDGGAVCVGIEPTKTGTRSGNRFPTTSGALPAPART